MNGRLSVIGIQGHVAYPHRANNPSTALVQILKELKEIKFDKTTDAGSDTKTSAEPRFET